MAYSCCPESSADVTFLALWHILYYRGLHYWRTGRRTHFVTVTTGIETMNNDSFESRYRELIDVIREINPVIRVERFHFLDCFRVFYYTVAVRCCVLEVKR